MKNILVFLGLLLMAGVSFFVIPSCTKPTIEGAELFPNLGNLKLFFTDTVTLNGFSDKPDSVATFNSGWSTSSSNGSHLGSMLLGCFKDPTFGTTKAYVFTQMAPTDSFNYTGVKVDSIIMYVPYNPAFVYGDTTQPVTLNVYRMTQDFSTSGLQYSNSGFATESTPLISYNYTPTPNTVNNDLKYNSTYPVPDTLHPHLRVKFTGQDYDNMYHILQDSNLYAHLVDSGNFLKIFKGLKFSLDTKGANSLTSYLIDSARLVVFHDSTSRFDYTMALGGNSAKGKNYFVHDYSNTGIPKNLKNRENDRLYLQDMAGPNIRMEIPYANVLGNLSETKKISVNKAELEFTIDDSDGVPPIDQIFIWKQGRDGSFTKIADASAADATYSTYGNYSVFGGYVTQDTLAAVVDTMTHVSYPSVMKRRYKMNMTAHFQKMVEGVEGPVIYIVPLYKAQKGGRSALYGPGYKGNPRFKTRLNLTYTKL